MSSGPVYSFQSAGETREVITADEAEALLGASDDRAEEVGSDRHARDAPGPVYRVEAVRGRFRIAHSESEARRGDVIRANQSARLMPHGRPIFAAVDAMPRSGDAELLVRISDFDLFPDPVSSFFAASDEGDEDIPAASDGMDSASWTGNLQVEGFGGTVANYTDDGEGCFSLNIPRAASEVTVHAEMLESDATAGWADGEDLGLFVEFVDESADDREVKTRRDSTDSTDYTLPGPTGEALVSVAVPTPGTVNVGLEELTSIEGNGTDEKLVGFHAMVR